MFRVHVLDSKQGTNEELSVQKAEPLVQQPWLFWQEVH